MTKDVPQETKLSTIGEFGLIERLTACQKGSFPEGIIGPGDDCAVLQSSFLGLSDENTSLLVTTDTLVDNTHFRLDFTSAANLGWKSLAVSLSDIAAMGGTPKVSLISLQLTRHVFVEWVEKLYVGLYDLAEKENIYLVGGDTVSGQELALSVTVFGSVQGTPIKRSRAKPGEELWVSGAVGGAGAALAILKGQLDATEETQRLYNRYRTPIPRITLGRALQQKALVSAMIDISDGLLQDAAHIAKESNVQLEISLEHVPYEAGILELGYTQTSAICAGDDYELLFSVPESSSETLMKLGGGIYNGEILPAITKIGKVKERKEDAPPVVVKLMSGEIVSTKELLQQRGHQGSEGFEHFR